MRSRCAAGIFHRSAVFSSRICLLVHLTIRPSESDSHSESYRASGRETEKYRKLLDSISYGSGIKADTVGRTSITSLDDFKTKVKSSMLSLQRNPEQVRSFFHKPS